MSDWLYKTWRTFLAFFRLNLSAVCEMSAGKGMYDYHYWTDGEWNTPLFFFPQVCRRCGKKFWG